MMPTVTTSNTAPSFQDACQNSALCFPQSLSYLGVTIEAPRSPRRLARPGLDLQAEPHLDQGGQRRGGLVRDLLGLAERPERRQTDAENGQDRGLAEMHFSPPLRKKMNDAANI